MTDPPATTYSPPSYSADPATAASELLDGAFVIVEMWDAQHPSQKVWKERWLSKARELEALWRNPVS